MKKQMWKIMICMAVGALSCHIKMLGCYPFVMAWMVAVYLEEFYRRAFLSMMLLWMFLWLPIASLSRYGITILTWMVVVAIGQRMQLRCSGFLQCVLAGAITTMVCCGGYMLTESRPMQMLLAVLEGMWIAGVSFLLHKLVAYFLSWEVGGKKEKETTLPVAMQQYAQAMAGLAQQMTDMVIPPKTDKTFVYKTLEQEVRGKMCVDCLGGQNCFGADGTMAIALEEIRQVMGQGVLQQQQVREKIRKQCPQGDVFFQACVQAFEKMELNRFWYGRLCEHRELIAGQIDAMSQVMGDCVEEEQQKDDREKWRLLQMKLKLKELGLWVGKMHFFERKNGSFRITVELATKKGVCITLKEVVQRLMEQTGAELVSHEENRSIVGREKREYTFLSRPKISCDYGVSKMVQKEQKISGDNFRAAICASQRFVMALSDGMGSGEQANRESEMVVDLFMQFVNAGFSAEIALRLMNAAMIFGAEKERFSTLDTCMVDIYTGIVDFYKVGAHVSFIRHKNRVEVIGGESLPMGADVTLDTTPHRSYLEPGDYLVMITDGVLEYLQVDCPVEVLQELIQELPPLDPASFSRKILERMLLFAGGNVLDDMTVLTLYASEG